MAMGRRKLYDQIFVGIMEIKDYFVLLPAETVTVLVLC